MKDCTTCKYGFVDEQFGFPMCHHPLRFAKDCVDFNMHEEIEEPKKATGIEEKKLPKGLDEAAEKYLDELFGKSKHQSFYKELFIAGAEWRYQKDRREFAKLKAKQWSDGYDEGIVKGKEQMMKDAVEGDYDCQYMTPAVFLDKYLDGIKDGDKVRIIIVKEEQK